MANSNKTDFFVSIIWGYPPEFFTYSAVENYHLHPLMVAKKMGLKPIAFIGSTEKHMEDDPHYDKDIQVIYYKNFLQYILFLVRHRHSLVYANTFVWKSFLIPFICRRAVFMGHHTVNRKTRLKQLIQDFVFKFFWRIRVVVEEEKDFLVSHGAKPGRVFIIPYALDTKKFSLEPDASRKHLLYLGKITRKKDPITILRAFGEVRKQASDMELHFIGELLDVKEEFTQTVKELDLEKAIKILGFKAHEELPRYINQYLIYVNSSIKEGQCLAVYESALCGLGLCLPEILAFKGVFKNKALFHPMRDYKKLANNILEYINNPALLKKHNQDCRVFIEEKYGEATIEQELGKLFK